MSQAVTRLSPLGCFFHFSEKHGSSRCIGANLPMSSHGSLVSQRIFVGDHFIVSQFESPSKSLHIYNILFADKNGITMTFDDVILTLCNLGTMVFVVLQNQTLIVITISRLFYTIFNIVS